MLFINVIFISIKPDDNSNVQKWENVKLEIMHRKYYVAIKMMFTKKSISLLNAFENVLTKKLF